MPHDDTLVDLVVSSGVITTTEDHEFWNVTDQAWQESQHLDFGDELLSADGTIVTVEGLYSATVHYSTAYDLTVDDIHTFYVAAGEPDVLVHNCSVSWAHLIPRRGSVAADLDAAVAHLRAIDGLSEFEPHQVAMVARIEDAIASGRPLTAGERGFLDHELLEVQYLQ